jgi:hypothetical protein
MRLRHLVFFVLPVTACATSSPPSLPEVADGITFGGGDGLMCETRVTIRGPAGSADGVPAEYAWLHRHYPGYKRGTQALIDCDGHPTDRLTFTTAEGKEVVIYFDISDFFGKGF